MKKISSFYVADRTTYEANIFTPTMNISTFTMNISTLSMNISTLSIKTILGSMLRSPLFFLFFLYAVTQFQGSCFAASSDNWSKETNLSKLAQMVRDARKVNSKLAEDINKHYIELYRKAIGTITVVDTAEVERLKNEISTLKAENSRLASELESQKDKLKNIDQLLGRADITPEEKAKLEEEKAKLEQEMKETKDKMFELNNQREELKKLREDLQKEKIDKETVQKKLEKLERERKELEAQLKDSEGTTLGEKLKAQLSSTRKKIQDFKKQLQDLKLKTEQQESLQKELSKIEEEKKKLKEELATKGNDEEIKKKLAELDGNAKIKQEDLDKLNSETKDLQELTQKLKDEQQRTEEFQKELLSILNDYNQTKTDLENATTDIEKEALKKKLQAFVKEFDDLRIKSGATDESFKEALKTIAIFANLELSPLGALELSVVFPKLDKEQFKGEQAALYNDLETKLNNSVTAAKSRLDVLFMRASDDLAKDLDSEFENFLISNLLVETKDAIWKPTDRSSLEERFLELYLKDNNDQQRVNTVKKIYDKINKKDQDNRLELTTDVKREALFKKKLEEQENILSENKNKFEQIKNSFNTNNLSNEQKEEKIKILDDIFKVIESLNNKINHNANIYLATDTLITTKDSLISSTLSKIDDLKKEIENAKKQNLAQNISIKVINAFFDAILYNTATLWYTPPSSTPQGDLSPAFMINDKPIDDYTHHLMMKGGKSTDFPPGHYETKQFWVNIEKVIPQNTFSNNQNDKDIEKKLLKSIISHIRSLLKLQDSYENKKSEELFKSYKESFDAYKAFDSNIIINEKERYNLIDNNDEQIKNEFSSLCKKIAAHLLLSEKIKLKIQFSLFENPSEVNEYLSYLKTFFEKFNSILESQDPISQEINSFILDPEICNPERTIPFENQPKETFALKELFYKPYLIANKEIVEKSLSFLNDFLNYSQTNFADQKRSNLYKNMLTASGLNNTISIESITDKFINKLKTHYSGKVFQENLLLNEASYTLQVSSNKNITNEEFLYKLFLFFKELESITSIVISDKKFFNAQRLTSIENFITNYNNRQNLKKETTEAIDFIRNTLIDNSDAIKSPDEDTVKKLQKIYDSCALNDISKSTIKNLIDKKGNASDLINLKTIIKDLGQYDFNPEINKDHIEKQNTALNAIKNDLEAHIDQNNNVFTYFLLERTEKLSKNLNPDDGTKSTLRPYFVSKEFDEKLLKHEGLGTLELLPLLLEGYDILNLPATYAALKALSMDSGQALDKLLEYCKTNNKWEEVTDSSKKTADIEMLIESVLNQSTLIGEIKKKANILKRILNFDILSETKDNATIEENLNRNITSDSAFNNLKTNLLQDCLKITAIKLKGALSFDSNILTIQKNFYTLLNGAIDTFKKNYENEKNKINAILDTLARAQYSAGGGNDQTTSLVLDAIKKIIIDIVDSSRKRSNKTYLEDLPCEERLKKEIAANLLRNIEALDIFSTIKNNIVLELKTNPPYLTSQRKLDLNEVSQVITNLLEDNDNTPKPYKSLLKKLKEKDHIKDKLIDLVFYTFLTAYPILFLEDYNSPAMPSSSLKKEPSWRAYKTNKNNNKFVKELLIKKDYFDAFIKIYDELKLVSKDPLPDLKKMTDENLKIIHYFALYTNINNLQQKNFSLEKSQALSFKDIFALDIVSAISNFPEFIDLYNKLKSNIELLKSSYDTIIKEILEIFGKTREADIIPKSGDLLPPPGGGAHGAPTKTLKDVPGIITNRKKELEESLAETISSIGDLFKNFGILEGTVVDQEKINTIINELSNSKNLSDAINESDTLKKIDILASLKKEIINKIEENNKEIKNLKNQKSALSSSSNSANISMDLINKLRVSIEKSIASKKTEAENIYNTIRENKALTINENNPAGTLDIYLKNNTPATSLKPLLLDIETISKSSINTYSDLYKKMKNNQNINSSDISTIDAKLTSACKSVVINYQALLNHLYALNTYNKGKQDKYDNQYLKTVLESKTVDQIKKTDDIKSYYTNLQKFMQNAGTSPDWNLFDNNAKEFIESMLPYYLIAKTIHESASLEKIIKLKESLEKDLDSLSFINSNSTTLSPEQETLIKKATAAQKKEDEASLNKNIKEKNELDKRYQSWKINIDQEEKKIADSDVTLENKSKSIKVSSLLSIKQGKEKLINFLKEHVKKLDALEKEFPLFSMKELLERYKDKDIFKELKENRNLIPFFLTAKKK